jgi:hypothetical protein
VVSVGFDFTAFSRYDRLSSFRCHFSSPNLTDLLNSFRKWRLSDHMPIRPRCGHRFNHQHFLIRLRTTERPFGREREQPRPSSGRLPGEAHPQRQLRKSRNSSPHSAEAPDRLHVLQGTVQVAVDDLQRWWYSGPGISAHCARADSAQSRTANSSLRFHEHAKGIVLQRTEPRALNRSRRFFGGCGIPSRTVCNAVGIEQTVGFTAGRLRRDLCVR